MQPVWHIKWLNPGSDSNGRTALNYMVWRYSHWIWIEVGIKIITISGLSCFFRFFSCTRKHKSYRLMIMREGGTATRRWQWVFGNKSCSRTCQNELTFWVISTNRKSSRIQTRTFVTAGQSPVNDRPTWGPLSCCTYNYGVIGIHIQVVTTSVMSFYGCGKISDFPQTTS